MTEEPPNFLQCIEWLRSDDALTFENGYHALVPRSREFRDDFVRLLHAESNPRMRARFVELLGDTEDPSVADILRAELQTGNPQVIPWALTALERVGSRHIADDYRRIHPEYE